MLWNICLIVSILSLIAGIFLAFGKNRSKKRICSNPYAMLFAGMVVAAFSLFFPICIHTFRDNGCSLSEIVLVTLHNVIKLFVVDGDFAFILSNLAADSYFVNKAYSIIAAVFYVVAPVLTFGFVLSFFKNLSSYLRYSGQYFRNVCVFTELNEKSLTLAEDIAAGGGKTALVFCSVIEDGSVSDNERIEQARSMGAICFQKDAVAANLQRHSKGSRLTFFAIGEDPSENIHIALKLIEKYKFTPNADLYVFSAEKQAELLIATAFQQPVPGGQVPMLKVRRINEVRSLIDRTLYETGYDNLFAAALPVDGEKQIHALILGMGHHGTEMTKALSWFCQMPGYYPRIDCFDIQSDAADKFAALCPELMSEDINGKWDLPGESKNKITVHSNVDVKAKAFDNLVTSMAPPSYIFISLGEDECNIQAAIHMRELFLRTGCVPKIQAVVAGTDRKEALTDIANFKGQRYAIDFIGDRKTLYSKDCIMRSDLEQIALERHLKWGPEEDFWRYDYHYRASIASAIHQKMKKLCAVPGIHKAPGERSEAELWDLRILEHCRWNAFMRSEGYVYSGSPDKASRNDLARMHHCLVPFGQLPLEEQIKDDD